MPGRLETGLENIGKRGEHTYDKGNDDDDGEKVHKFLLVSFGHDFYYTLRDVIQLQKA